MQLSEAEWKIMASVWRRGVASARDVCDDQHDGTGWAYTTVKTMLDRLVEKRVLKSRKQGLAIAYTPRVAAHDVKRSAVAALVERAFSGVVPLMQFLLGEQKLTPKERQELIRMLREQDGTAAT